jgi:hypothetical protein
MKKRKIKKIIIVIAVLFLVLTTIVLLKLTQTPENYYPKASLLSLEEIKNIESYLGVKFPLSVKKIHAYMDDTDLCHLYVRIEFDKTDMNLFQGNFQWLSSETFSVTQMEILTWPVKRVFTNTFAQNGGIELEWWKPDRANITLVHEDSKYIDNDIEVSLTILIEEANDDSCFAYITKNETITTTPKEIELVFPEKTNWDLRESRLYPFK